MGSKYYIFSTCKGDPCLVDITSNFISPTEMRQVRFKKIKRIQYFKFLQPLTALLWLHWS